MSLLAPLLPGQTMLFSCSVISAFSEFYEESMTEKPCTTCLFFFPSLAIINPFLQRNMLIFNKLDPLADWNEGCTTLQRGNHASHAELSSRTR